MLFECEAKLPLKNPKPWQIKRSLLALRSYGPSSYASLTDEGGSYLQIAGGGGTCLLEMYQADTKKRFRGYGDVPNKIYPDGTILVFRAGQIPMKSDEWFSVEKIIDVFCAFLEGCELPGGVYWRLAPGF